MKQTQTPRRKAELVYTFEEAAQYHHVPVERIQTLAEAGHFGKIGYVSRGQGRREYLIPAPAMKRPLPNVSGEGR